MEQIRQLMPGFCLAVEFLLKDLCETPRRRRRRPKEQLLQLLGRLIKAMLAMSLTLLGQERRSLLLGWIWTQVLILASVDKRMATRLVTYQRCLSEERVAHLARLRRRHQRFRRQLNDRN